MLQEAEDNYYITAKYLLELANKAYELFESSEVEERRQLIRLALQNLELKGKNVQFQAQKPFDTILNYNEHQLWLERRSDFYGSNWLEVIDYPDVVIQQTKCLLGVN